jgi:pSer/pThr/pTyr-binding forkhead associated (FHA) protein
MNSREDMSLSQDSASVRSVGQSSDSDLILCHESVAPRHARVEITGEGYLAVHDEESPNGTFLKRNGRWVRIRRIVLGTGDRVRFGDEEVTVEQLLALYGRQIRVRLRDGEDIRSRVVFDRPRRNPLTGKIEERLDMDRS